MSTRSPRLKLVPALIIATSLCSSIGAASGQSIDLSDPRTEDGVQVFSLTREQALGLAESISVNFDFSVTDNCLSETSLLEADVHAKLEAAGLEVMDDPPETSGPSNPTMLVVLAGFRLDDEDGGDGAPCAGQLNMYVYLDGGSRIYDDLIVENFLFDFRPPALVEGLAGKIIVWSNSADRIFFGRESLDSNLPYLVMTLVHEFTEEMQASRAANPGN